MQALLELSDDQIQDSLYIRRIVAARAAELELQQRQVCAQMAAKSASKQHPSDHLAAAREVADKMKLMGEEEYKLHGIVTDALFNGVCAAHVATPSMQLTHPGCWSLKHSLHSHSRVAVADVPLIPSKYFHKTVCVCH